MSALLLSLLPSGLVVVVPVLGSRSHTVKQQLRAESATQGSQRSAGAGAAVAGGISVVWLSAHCTFLLHVVFCSVVQQCNAMQVAAAGPW